MLVRIQKWNNLSSRQCVAFWCQWSCKLPSWLDVTRFLNIPVVWVQIFQRQSAIHHVFVAAAVHRDRDSSVLPIGKPAFQTKKNILCTTFSDTNVQKYLQVVMQIVIWLINKEIGISKMSRKFQQYSFLPWKLANRFSAARNTAAINLEPVQSLSPRNRKPQRKPWTFFKNR